MDTGPQVSGVGCQVSVVTKARASLKPETVCFEKASPRPIMSKKKTCFSIMLRDAEVDLTIRFNEQRAKRSQKKEVEDYNGKMLTKNIS